MSKPDSGRSLVGFYHRLPYPLRMAAASARGYYLRSWRYNGQTETRVAEALERDTWSADCWKNWQDERLAFILSRSARHVPYYQDQWRKRRRAGDRASWEVLANWPVLTKEELRASPQAFVADDCAVERMFVDHTSGTTGKPLSIWLSRATLVEWYALYEARVRRWHGVSRRDRWAMIGGQLVTPVRQERPPFWVWNAGLNQLYLSSYHLKPAHIRAYIDALARHEVAFMLGYSSSMESLALLAREENLRIPFSLQVVTANAEPLYPHQRELISNIFGCRVSATYGMTELVAAASECEHGRLHLWPEVGRVEVLESGPANDEPAVGEMGALICTGLLNPDMPLIRYDTGDSGTLAMEGSPCPCGRRLPILDSVEGRRDDVILTPDGRRIGRLDPVFKANFAIREAQIIQESLERLRLRYVPAPGFSPAQEQVLQNSLRQRVGEMDIILEAVESIPRGPSGKFQAVISQIQSTPVKR